MPSNFSCSFAALCVEVNAVTVLSAERNSLLKQIPGPNHTLSHEGICSSRFTPVIQSQTAEPALWLPLLYSRMCKAEVDIMCCFQWTSTGNTQPHLIDQMKTQFQEFCDDKGIEKKLTCAWKEPFKHNLFVPLHSLLNTFQILYICFYLHYNRSYTWCKHEH